MNKYTLYKKIMQSVSEQLINELNANDINEDWKSNLKGTALGLGLGALTLGTQSCTKQQYNEPDAPINTMNYNIQHNDYDPGKEAISKEFINELKRHYPNNWSSFPAGTLFISSYKFVDNDVHDCEGKGWIYCLKKTNNDGGVATVIKFKHPETLNYVDSLGKYSVVTREEIQQEDERYVKWVEVSNDGNGNGNCTLSKEYKFFIKYTWENGDERVFEKWRRNENNKINNYITTLKCIDIKNKKYTTITYNIDNLETYNSLKIGDLYFPY